MIPPAKPPRNATPANPLGLSVYPPTVEPPRVPYPMEVLGQLGRLKVVEVLLQPGKDVRPSDIDRVCRYVQWPNGIRMAVINLGLTEHFRKGLRDTNEKLRALNEKLRAAGLNTPYPDLDEDEIEREEMWKFRRGAVL